MGFAQQREMKICGSECK